MINKSILKTTLIIDPQKEAKKIGDFLIRVKKQTGFKRVILGVSGGVDSAVALVLACKSFGKNNTWIVWLPFGKQKREDIDELLEKFKIPQAQRITIDIEPAVLKLEKILNNILINEDIYSSNIKDEKKIAKGNMIARIRMIVLYDLAKKINALVLGTENKSEHLLGYFTRYGDEASDIEPIRHLYKTQIYQLANFLKIPKNILVKPPSAGLWKGQTDEKELGFTYEEADKVLAGLANEAEGNGKKWLTTYDFNKKVIKRIYETAYKRKTPYKL